MTEIEKVENTDDQWEFGNGARARFTFGLLGLEALTGESLEAG